MAQPNHSSFRRDTDHLETGTELPRTMASNQGGVVKSANL